MMASHPINPNPTAPHFCFHGMISCAGAPQMCIAAPQSVVYPAPAAGARGSPDTVAYLTAVRNLPPPQQRRLADALFMQAAAMHLFQMHSALPPATLTAHIARDRHAADVLTRQGMNPDVPCAKPAPGSGSPMAGEAPGASDDPTNGWCEDYRTILKVSTVCPSRSPVEK